jgi:hypothetical protein
MSGTEKLDFSEASNTTALLEKLIQLVVIQQNQMITIQNALIPQTTSQPLPISSCD